MTGVTAAGSPGPFETNTPSGPRARISAAAIPAGTTSRPAPGADAGAAAMLSFMPQSMATTRGPSRAERPRAGPGRPRRRQVAPVEHRVLAHPGEELLGPELGARRRRACAAVAQVAHQAAGVAVLDRPPRPRSRSQVRQPTAPPAPGASPARAITHRARPGAVALVVRPGPRRSCRSSAP